MKCIWGWECGVFVWEKACCFDNKMVVMNCIHNKPTKQPNQRPVTQGSKQASKQESLQETSQPCNGLADCCNKLRVLIMKFRAVM
jgi:hypothetical protein